MKVFRFSTFALALLVAFASCAQKEENPQQENKEGTTAKAPVISAQNTNVQAQAGTYTLEVSVANPAEGKKLSAALVEAADWITLGQPTDEGIPVTVTDNLSEARTAQVKLSYGGAQDVTVDFCQDKWVYGAFEISASGIGPFGVTISVTRKAGYNGGYFFEVFEKKDFAKYVESETNKLGDFAYGQKLYESDKQYLNNLAQQHGHELSMLFSMLQSMYCKDESVDVPYSSLATDTDHIFVVYGMEDSNAATRKTPICLYEFRTGFSTSSELTFAGEARDIAENYAELSVTASDPDQYWYMTWASEIQLKTTSLATLMQNSINTAKSYVGKSDGMGGVYTAERILCKGRENVQASDLMPGTQYSVIAWGMNLDMESTTAPVEVFTFKSKEFEVVDDCTFQIEVLDIEDMDVHVRVTPSNLDTRYYIAFVAESLMEGYSDEQAAQRIINMEAQRIEQHYYDVENLSWANLPGLEAGVRDTWGRRNEGWTFKPEHTYHIYVFGIDNFGIRSTVVARKDVTTANGASSENTFTLDVTSATWQGIDFNVTPANQDYWTYFIIETADLETYRIGSGLDEKAIMHEIEEYYEHNSDNILYYTYNKKVEGLHTYVTPETMYSILVFGYSGTNSTPMYEWQVYAPAPPFDKSTADFSYTFELFRGEDLTALDPVIWPAKDFEEDCIMVTRIVPTDNTVHWCLGVWPPKENYRDSGGKYHLMHLDLDETHSIQDKKFWRTRPWWYGCGNGSATKKEPWADDEGHIMNYYPWTISGWAEDAEGNYGPWHYDYLIPIPKPKDSADLGPYEYGYTEAYNFWSAPAQTPDMQVYSVSKGESISFDFLKNDK